jgi:hypothetical protein
MQRTMKENQTVMPVIDTENQRITWHVRGMPDIVLDMTKVSEANIHRAAYAGIAQQRVVDGAAVPAADDDGNIIPAAERTKLKHERMSRIVAHLESGSEEWNLAGAGIGGGKSITIEAIAQVQKLGYDEAKAQVTAFAEKKHRGDTKAALAFFRTAPLVIKAMQEIRAERMPAPKVDADKALAELGK